MDLLDFASPVAVLLVGLLHFIQDSDKPYEVVARLRDAVTAGSYLAISQVSMPAEITPEQEETMARYHAAIPVALRQRDEIVAFFDGFELLPPGVVDAAEWRPEPDDLTDMADLVPSYAGVAVKR